MLQMSNLLPQLHSLSRDEKLKVIKFLIQDLEREDVNTDELISSESVFLSQQDWERVNNLIANPPSLNSALLSALERYNQEVIN